MGIRMMLGGIGYLLVILVFFIVPSFAIVGSVGAVLAGLAELSLMALLLINGINVPDSQSNLG
jgi:hypothetical protein